ncbi:PQQ-dependent sugar dehydrogenase [Solicola gregarius]|uniref:PQQ-dependent sugar dehydrogenase n=1 Tax=Solicola gregarius TaxID=2908642 RepID=A0AA46YMC5_9ACTN|nr:PQQ-dependent sugar dehydrogenase [Solicola gregarius]UYM06494.1 PQQ-dependent sugar dehydrogenase [Solicola gregarius]
MSRIGRTRPRTLIAALGVAAAMTTAFLTGGPATNATNAADEAAKPPAAKNWDNYEKVTLTKHVGEPIDLAVLPDSRVLHTARSGELRLTDPDTGLTKIVNDLDVYNNSEMGLQTVTLAPEFKKNHWVYVYYSPKRMTGKYPKTTPTGSAPTTLPDGKTDAYWKRWKGYDQLSRFKWNPKTDKLKLSTEQRIIKVETNRGQCCHVAGDVDFDAKGNLYLSTGGNTPAGADGYTPIDDSPRHNPGDDERRGSGNSNDLRGKILRIHVQKNGSYTIPKGNLFPKNKKKTRPEIYVMGLRNPYRMTVDKATGAVSWGDYGPDAGAAKAKRGPMGYVEWNVTTKAMNSGWPYCTGDNSHPYFDYDFKTDKPGKKFNCAAPVNDSRWNDGLRKLPPSVPADLWYGDDKDDQPWPKLTELGGEGQAPMAGPRYHYSKKDPKTAFPKYWDGKWFFGEFSQDYLAAFTTKKAEGPVTRIESLLPNSALSTNGQPINDNPMDLEFGPDGSLYVLDYGDGFFTENPDAGLYRIDYVTGNKRPIARVTADPTSGGAAPLEVAFDASASTDPEGADLKYEWDFDGDGTFDGTGAKTNHTYEKNGQVDARVRVSDPDGAFSITSEQITVGNTAPTVTLDTPANGGFFDWGDSIAYQVKVTDPEDGDSPECDRVQWTTALGHNQHAHPITQGSGCSGDIPLAMDGGHGETENVFGVIGVTYTDNGANGVPGATGETQIILNPKHQEGEHADELEGVTISDDQDASGLRKLTSFGASDWIAYDPVSLSGIDSVSTTASGEGTLSLRWGASDAEPFATVDVPAGDGWQTVDTELTDPPTGSDKLYVTSTGGVDVDMFMFNGAGVGGE